MARTRTLTNLIADVRAAGDFESDPNKPDALITDRINENIAGFWNILLQAYGEDYLRKECTVTTVAGTEYYTLASLAADFWFALGFDLSYNGAIYDLPKFSFHERNIHKVTSNQRGVPRAARISTTSAGAEAVQLSPVPDGAYSVLVHYIPAPVRLVNGSDTFNGVAGWESYVVWSTVADLKAKEESDPSYALAMAAKWEKDIRANAPQRSRGVERIKDVYKLRRLTLRPWDALPRP
jgi:hypothetical protein